MMSPSGTQDLDALYIKLLVKNGFVSAANVSKYIKHLKLIQKSGKDIDFSMFLLRKKIITLEQHRTILKQMSKLEIPDSQTKDQGLCQFGPYKVMKKVATGAMGIIFQVEDIRDGRILALKTLLRGVEAEMEDIRRFRREALTSKKVRDPGVVSVIDVGRYQNIWFMTMDFIEGPSLEEIMGERRLSIRESAQIGADIASALAAIHRAGIVHRDIKPDNILLDTRTNPPRYKIIDFSLAMFADPEEIKLTKTGLVVGTPYYMAPEQTLGDRAKIDGRTDIYSLGVLIFELLAGGVPFTANTLPDLYRKIQHSPVPSLRELNPEVPHTLENIIMKTLEKVPEFRYPSGEELAHDLLDFLNDKPLSITRTHWMKRKLNKLKSYDHKLMIGVLILIVFIVICLFIYYIGWKLPGKRQKLNEKNTGLGVCDKNGKLATITFRPRTSLPEHGHR